MEGLAGLSAGAAAALNERGDLGVRWHSQTVMRVSGRLDRLSDADESAAEGHP